MDGVSYKLRSGSASQGARRLAGASCLNACRLCHHPHVVIAGSCCGVGSSGAPAVTSRPKMAAAAVVVVVVVVVVLLLW